MSRSLLILNLTVFILSFMTLTFLRKLYQMSLGRNTCICKNIVMLGLHFFLIVVLLEYEELYRAII